MTTGSSCKAGKARESTSQKESQSTQPRRRTYRIFANALVAGELVDFQYIAAVVAFKLDDLGICTVHAFGKLLGVDI